MYFQCNIQSSLYWTVHYFCSQLWKVFEFFLEGLSDPSCSVLLEAERALHFFTPPFPVVFHFCAVSWGANLIFIQSLSMPFWAGCVPWFLFWEAWSVKVPCVNPECRTCIQKTWHAQYSCLKEQCRTLNWVLRNIYPLEHLVLQHCSDSHQGHSFFSRLWSGSPAGPWL